MKQRKRDGVCLVLAFLIFLGLVPSVYGAEDTALLETLADTAAAVYKTVQNPQLGSIGGEWAVLGLARCGYEIPADYFDRYYKTVEDGLKACGGILNDKKYTEYSKLVIALTAIGKNPADVAGYNLLTALGDYDKTISQGINGAIWALLALDSKDYDIPLNPTAKTQATRELYLTHILDCQLPDGGWSLSGGPDAAPEDPGSDPDVTGMALQALANYQNIGAVSQATEQALACMSAMQNENGGYASWGTENAESSIQMIVALCELGISLNDPQFVKNGNTLLDHLIMFYLPGNGFLHTTDGTAANQMTSEQGLYALAAVKRALDGKNSLYRMGDVPSSEGGNAEPGIGLPGKDAEVQKMPVTQPGVTFADCAGHENQTAIEALAGREIINGKSAAVFDPDATMTRAEFAAVVVRGLGLPGGGEPKFEDVPAAEWYASFVNAAYRYGLVTGVSDTSFEPNGTITREEAAVMTARAARLCGLDTALSAAAARDILAGFIDYITISGWARGSVAFCYREGILPGDELEVLSKQEIKRCEIAQMLYQMLGKAELL